jgi:uridylate kinase
MRVALADALERLGLSPCADGYRNARIAEPYIRLRAVRHLEKGRIVIFGGRHRQPYLHGFARRCALPKSERIC